MENKKGKPGSRLAGSEAFLSVAASLVCIVIGLLLFFFRALIYGGTGGGGDDDRAHHDADQHEQQCHQHGSAPLAIQFSADRLHFRHLPFC